MQLTALLLCALAASPTPAAKPAAAADFEAALRGPSANRNAKAAPGSNAPQCADPKPLPADFRGGAYGMPPKEAEEPPDPDPFAFSAYRDRRPEFLDTALVNGAKLSMAQLIVNDPPAQVLAVYREQLAKLKITPIEGAPPQAPGMRYLSFRRLGSKYLKTITLLPYGRGTMILASVGDPSPMFKTEDEADNLPRPPGAGASVRTMMGEPGNLQRHSSFVVRGLMPGAVRQFYAEAMPERGFKALGSSDHANTQGPLYFRQGNEQVTITTTAADTVGDTRVTVVWLTEGSG